MSTTAQRKNVLQCLVTALAGLTAFAALTGCGIGPVDTSETGTMQISGRVMGGQQPVANSHIYMYQPGLAGTGTAANGGAATSMQLLPVTTDQYGQFNLTGAYLCANNNSQAYMVSVGGNPGLPTVGGVTPNNGALVLMTALGRCGDLYTTAYVEVNELTTVAAAYALGPFYTAYDHIGASSTNAAGMANAFANAALLADPHTAQVVDLGSSRAVETGKLYALANAVAACVNSDGSGCTPLFTAATPAGGTAPTNTMDAIVNITRNPGNNVTAVYQAQGSFPPFPSVLKAAPNDWTMSMTVTGGGLSSPSGLAVDASGYVWVADYTGALSEFSAQGVAQSPSTGYGNTVLSESYGMAIGPTGYVWTTSAESPYHYPTVGSAYEFYGSGSAHPGNTYVGPIGDYSVNYPTSVSVDTDNSAYVNNYYGASATRMIPFVSTTGGYGSGSSDFPVAVAVDAQHGVWIANNSDNTITHVSSTGTVLAHPTCCNSANGLAVDSSGNVWVSNYFSSSVSEVTSAGAVALNQVTGGGIAYPAGLVIDGAQDVWIANYRGMSISKVAGNSNTMPAGTGLSPAIGYGRDTSLVLPFTVGVDYSGDVWVSSFNNARVIEFIGLAAPTKTPVTATPSAP